MACCAHLTTSDVTSSKGNVGRLLLNASAVLDFILQGTQICVPYITDFQQKRLHHDQKLPEGPGLHLTDDINGLLRILDLDVMQFLRDQRFIQNQKDVAFELGWPKSGDSFISTLVVSRLFMPSFEITPIP